MNLVSWSLMKLARTLEAAHDALQTPRADASTCALTDGAHSPARFEQERSALTECSVCEAFGIDLDNPDEPNWFDGDEFEEGDDEDIVARAVLEGYAEEIAEATILHASKIAKIGRKWGLAD